jgi:hypothetical protein
MGRRNLMCVLVEVVARRVQVSPRVVYLCLRFQCIVICSDTMKSFPAPDGLSREFMRSFGVFPVVLVNCNLEIK